MESFLSIQQVARLFSLSPHTLRYYEQIGLIHPIARNSGGRRRYTQADMDWLRFLTRLRSTGMPIADMLRYAQLRQQGEHTAAARQALLEEHLVVMQAKIAELQALAGFVADKVAWYRSAARGAPTQNEQEHNHASNSASHAIRTTDRPTAARKRARQTTRD